MLKNNAFFFTEKKNMKNFQKSIVHVRAPAYMENLHFK